MRLHTKLPDCFEKVVYRVCYYLSLILTQGEDTIFYKEKFEDEIQKDISKIFGLFEKEEYREYKVKNVVDEILKNGLQPSNYEFSLKQLFSIIDLIRPFCLQEFFELVTESSSSSKLIEDQTIILMLGATGVGKSTTIQYLCGSEMHRADLAYPEQYGIPHIEAKKITNKDLSKIITRPNMKSVTRLVTPISISYENPFRKNLSRIVIVDTPGTGDTQSKEVDVANTIGIVNAIKGAKAVYPVIILSQKNFGGRSEILKSQIQYYSRMIKHVSEYIGSFTYLFTHMHPDWLKSLETTLMSLLKDGLSASEQNDESLLRIFEDMTRKVKNGHTCIIDPLDGNYKSVLYKIMTQRPINDPQDVFKLTITDKSMNAIISQIQMHEKAIEFAIIRGDNDLAYWKLEEIRQLKDIFNHDPSFQKHYKDILQVVGKIITTNCEKAQKMITKGLSVQYALSEEDLYQFIHDVKFAQNLEGIRANFLQGLNVSSGQDLMQSLFCEIRGQLTLEMDKLSIRDTLWHEYFQKLELLSKTSLCQQPEMQKLYQDFIDFYLKKAEDVYVKANETLHMADLSKYSWVSGPDHLSSSDQQLSSILNDDEERINKNLIKTSFEEGAEEESKRPLEISNDNKLKKMQLKRQVQVNKLLKPHEQYAECVLQLIQAGKLFHSNQLFASKIEEWLQKLLMTLFDKVKENLSKVYQSNENFQALTQEEVFQIQVSLNFIESFNTQFKNLNTNFQKKTKELLDDVIEKLLSRYNILTNDLFEAIKSPNPQNSDLKVKFDQIVLQRKISQISSKTFSSFEQLQSIIQTKILDTTKEIESILDKLVSLQNNYYSTFKTLGDRVKCLLNLRDFIKSSRQSFIAQMTSDLKKQFSEILTRLQDDVEGKQLTPEYYGNLEYVSNVLFQINEIYKISKDLDFLAELKPDVGSSWIEQIDKSLAEIQRFLEAKKDTILTFKDFRRADLFLYYLQEFEFKPKLKQISLKISWENLLKAFTELVQSQKQLIEKELQTKLTLLEQFFNDVEKIEEYKNCEMQEPTIASQEQSISFAQSSAEDLYYHLSLIIGIEEKFPKLFILIDDPDDVQWNIKTIYSKKISLFGQQLHQVAFNSRTDVLQKKVQVLTYLKDLDQLLHPKNQPFQKAFENHFAILYNNPDKQINSAESAYKINDFKSIKSQLTELEQAGLNQQHFKQIAIKIIAFLVNQTEDMIKEAKRAVISSKELSAEAIFKIAETMSRIDFMNSELNVYIDVPTGIINKTFLGIIDNIVNNLSLILKQAGEDLSSQQFSGAFFQLNKINDIFNSLITRVNYQTTQQRLENHKGYQELTKKVNECNNEIIQEIQTQFKKIQDSKYCQFIYLKPKLIIENVKQIAGDNRLRQSIKKFEDSLIIRYLEDITSYSDQIRKADSETDSKRFSKQLKEIESSLSFVSDSIVQEVKPQLDAMKLKNRETIKKREQSMDFAIKQESPVDLIKFYEMSKKISHEHKLMVEIKLNEHFISQCQKIVNHLEQSIDIMSPLELLDDLYNQFMTKEKVQMCLNTNSRNALQRLYYYFNERYQNAMNELSHYFSERFIVERDKVIDAYDVGLIQGKTDEESKQTPMPRSSLRGGSSAIMPMLPAVQLIFQLIQTLNEKPSLISQVLPDFGKQISRFLDEAKEYYIKIKESFNQNINQKLLKECMLSLLNLQNCEIVISGGFQNLLSQLKGINDQSQLKELLQSFNISNAKNEFFNLIISLQNQIVEKDFINDLTAKIESVRIDFYSKLQINFQQISFVYQNRNLLGQWALEEIQNNFGKADKFVRSQTNAIINDATMIVTSIGASMQKKDYQRFKLLYDNLQSLDTLDFISDKQLIKENIKRIESQIENKIKSIIMKSQALYKKNNADPVNYKILSDYIVELQIMLENMSNFNDYIQEQIDFILQDFLNERVDDNEATNELRLHLRITGHGANLVSKHKIFLGINIAENNKKYQTMSIQNVISKLDGTNINKQALLQKYERYKQAYDKIIDDALVPEYDPVSQKRLPINYKHVTSQITEFLTDPKAQRWGKRQITDIHLIVANIFALWTLMNTQHYEKQAKTKPKDRDIKNYLLQPHAAQVISIFRILGYGYEKQIKGLWQNIKNTYKYQVGEIKKLFGDEKDREMYENLVQIKTGEGKSVTLAVVAMILALNGFDIRCTCYSSYLSQRDFDAFYPMYQELGIQKYIQFGTFNEICEEQINKDGSIRDLMLKVILKDGPALKIDKNRNQRPMVLLIDEVDVFFSKDFYGNKYFPLAKINHPYVSALIDYVWSIRNNVALLKRKKIKETQPYKNCISLINPDYVCLIDEALGDMICDVEEIDRHKYILDKQKGKIGYKEQDEISFKKSFGYLTMFAYYKEQSGGNISSQSLEENKAIGINCGQFSYAEVPNDFAIILGVTGTLETLTKSEMTIISDVYQIKNFTYAPSVYGDNQLIFEPRTDVKIVDRSLYFSSIVNNLTSNLVNQRGKRAALIFFKNDNKLQEFYSSSEFGDFKKNCIILNERVENQQRERDVGRSTSEGMVTLATSAYGRGTDFICRDPNVEKAGGMHVIQTFLSETQSEEIQIKGRTGRQGNQGSYCMILLTDDLQSFNIEHQDVATEGSKYEMLRNKRDSAQSMKNNDTTIALQDIKSMHKQSEKSIITARGLLSHQSSTTKNDVKEMIKFLKKINQGRLIETSSIVTKTIVLMDATGSMASMISKSKNAVGVMYERAQKVLEENGFDPNVFLIQFACFRNYNSPDNLLLEHSQFESTGQKLWDFMNKVTSSGGWGQEAVEIGLWHVNREIANNNGIPVSQVFIIGDAGPNSVSDVTAKRAHYGEPYWQSHVNFIQPTHFEKELKSIKAAKIPVFAFHVVPTCKTAFDKLVCNGGVNQYLDINNENIGQKLLTDVFTQQILQKIGEANGGEEVAKTLVGNYIASYAQ